MCGGAARIGKPPASHLDHLPGGRKMVEMGAPGSHLHTDATSPILTQPRKLRQYEQYGRNDVIPTLAAAIRCDNRACHIREP